jgi:hypothetical protein
MTSLPSLTQFLNAKAEFLTKARKARAVDGVINGRELEEELVSTSILISF